jgi:uncharacterized protein (DUF305 family)
MNRQPLLVAVGALLLLGIGIFGALRFTESEDEAGAMMTMADGTVMPVEQMPGGASADESVPFDQAFIDAMIPHHDSAIAMANEAKAAGLTQPELIEIADAIIETQQDEIDQMMNWRQEWYGSSTVDPAGAAALGMSMAEMGMEHDPSALAEAADVDAAFAAMMIDHHNGAIAMARRASREAEREEIRSLAADIVAAQESEIEVMTEHAAGQHHG